MNEIKDLDFLVKERFEELLSDLKSDEQKLVNHKSVENFILYLIDKPLINQNKNKSLQELGEIRMKKRLLEFFQAVRNTDLNNQTAIDLYQKYIMKIGEFMTEYYGFTGNGGKLKILTVLMILTLGIVLDTITTIFDWLNYPIFTPLFIILFSVRYLIKYKQRKIYGILY
jgi:hypothetical protein